jgi:serine/threonine-protein kinase
MDEKESGSFGALLSRYRAAVGLSQEELAEQSGLSVRGVSDLERGARMRPYATTVHQLAEALRLSPDDRAILEQAARKGKGAGTHAVSSPAPGSFLGAAPRGPLVGREEEMGRVRSALQAVAQGTGQFLLLVGELGVGKTRLAQEATVQIRDPDALPGKPARFLLGTGRCYQRNQYTPYVPLFEALSELAETSPSGVHLAFEPPWEKLRQDVGALVNSGVGGIDAHHDLFAAVADFMTTLADVAPVALVLDDLHHADDGTISLLQHLAREMRGKQVLLVATMRDTNLSEEHALLVQMLRDLARERLAERIVIRRLSAEETTRLAASLMGQETIADDIAALIYRRAKGIPRFIEGMVQSLGGRLELHGEIGAGAMGRVFAAYDAQTDREVAAKLMLARGEVDLDTVLSFQHEAAVLAKLRHPGIVEIYDSFIDEHASCIIMERLDGQSLGRILQRGPLPLSRAKNLAQQVADALSYAHTQHIVHRDIKPDNVMVLEGDQVKVTDFGIARILQPDTSLHTMATTGMRMGTPLYMAPEQIEGKKVDARTDVYALGAMLYHMITGRPPFEGSDALTVAVKHLQEEPAPPSQINPVIPADWDALILKAMAKNPVKRFQSADEMKSAMAVLSEHAASGTAAAHRRWPLAAVAGAIVLAAVLAGVWIHSASGSQHAAPASSVDAYLTQHHFSGYVLLERHGHVLLSKGYGKADARANLPNTIWSRWPAIGADKLMTAIAILRLQDQSKLSVHDKICRYVAACPSAWHHITIQQLLADTSGLDSFDIAPAPHSVAQALAQCRALPVGAPTVGDVESNCDNLLLNIIISAVSGKPWPAAMHDLVFGPAHMIDSGRITNVGALPGRVQGYSAGAPVQLGDTGGYFLPYSSIQDLERMDTALLSGRLLSRVALHALFTPFIRGSGVVGRYFFSHGTNAGPVAGGYEWYFRQATRTTVTVADKPGAIGGVHLDDAVSPRDGTLAIVAQNDESGPDPTDVLFGVASHLLWDKPAASAQPPQAPGTRIAAYLTRARFSGYAYLERRGHVILSKGFGLADAESNVPNTLHTKWPFFGETRFLVALAIMRLHDEGKLSVQDGICRYVSDCPAAWQPITIRDLLTNTSGMGSFDPFAPGVTLARTMAACKGNPLSSPPGTQTNQGTPWSDCNTVVLGSILDKLTGKTWEGAMRQLVFGPAGMTDTGRMTNALRPPQRGRLYRAGVATRELNYDGFDLAYTTVADVIRLNHALLAGKVVSRRSLDAMFTPLFHDSPNDSSSPYRGYEVDIWPATATTYESVLEGTVNGGGEDDEGIHAGFFVDINVSPAARALQVVIINDSAYFTGDSDNAFDSFVRRQLYGK